MDLPGAVPGGIRGMELHIDGCDGFLQLDVFVQELAPGTRSDRQAQYAIFGLVLLCLDVRFGDRQSYHASFED